MNRQRDIERVLETWLLDGPSAMPDRLFDAVFDQVERVPQRRLARLRMRLTEMNPRIRTYTLAAAGLVVALVGLYLIGRGPSDDVASSPSPAATSTASPQEVPSALQQIWMGPPKVIPGLDPEAGVTLNFGSAGTFWIAQSAAGSDRRMQSQANAIGDNRFELVTGRDIVDCTDGGRGTYAWELSPTGRALTITGESDTCAARASTVPGTYLLMDCPTVDDNCLGPVDPGTYSSQFFDPWVAPGGDWKPRFDALRYTVPDGWINVADWPTSFSLGPATTPDTAVYVSSDIVISDQAEACSELRDPTIGMTAADITTALASATGVVASTPEAVTIGGLDGFWTEISLDPEWTQPCPWSGGRAVRTLLTDRSADAGYAWAIEPDHEARLYFLDVIDGRALMIMVESRRPLDFEAVVDEMVPVIDSFVFTP